MNTVVVGNSRKRQLEEDCFGNLVSLGLTEEIAQEVMEAAGPRLAVQSVSWVLECKAELLKNESFLEFVRGPMEDSSVDHKNVECFLISLMKSASNDTVLDMSALKKTLSHKVYFEEGTNLRMPQTNFRDAVKMCRGAEIAIQFFFYTAE